ncbi:MAG: hypothetical protein A2745_02675 [Candidatus Harrisonbacteria bacterium RIFCSPHIGHO2_01_FULL_44_13]|uniref:Uncharacterized protein n=1 Tax=Candidatus Harrisonbacteria bacterium RIFCSPLOWO2_01_FULL_44_18 TaxID=1798407 RepID=A0A1G1ZNN6_9BACT|nr:MAG: hypothetical protein A2745_02675 [Candidatus Harrisonbacteria bacterium RIFCSPHIGHO2_01_FULL_44_13]OGY66288.1 MAG: hypothetical protein A3A16_00035 [Candidatus Harrisonbacteria bacterium RIFCSPLOWO2_01_FULL_44_18]
MEFPETGLIFGISGTRWVPEIHGNLGFREFAGFPTGLIFGISEVKSTLRFPKRIEASIGFGNRGQQMDSIFGISGSRWIPEIRSGNRLLAFFSS